MNEHDTEQRLHHWGRWAVKHHDGGIGYPTQSPIAEMAKYGTALEKGKGAKLPQIDPQAEQVERHWRQLRKDNELIAESIRLKYVRRYSERDIEKTLSKHTGSIISRPAVRRYLAMGVGWFGAVL